MGTMKDRNSKDLTEAEEIKKRWQEQTEELYKKGLNDLDNHDGVIHLEPDILECEVKWALGRIAKNKASGGDGNSSWTISNPKRWCCESAALNIPVSKFGKLSSGHRIGKGLVIPIPKKGNTKECSNCHTTALTSHAQNPSCFSSTWTEKFQMYKLDFKKAEEPEVILPTSIGSQKKQNSRKTSTSASVTMLKPLTVWITTNWKILQEMGIPDHLTYLLRSLFGG